MNNKHIIEFDVQNRSTFSLEQVSIETNNGTQIPEKIQRPMRAMGATNISYSVLSGGEGFSSIITYAIHGSEKISRDGSGVRVALMMTNGENKKFTAAFSNMSENCSCFFSSGPGNDESGEHTSAYIVVNKINSNNAQGLFALNQYRRIKPTSQQQVNQHIRLERTQGTDKSVKSAIINTHGGVIINFNTPQTIISQEVRYMRPGDEILYRNWSAESLMPLVYKYQTTTNPTVQIDFNEKFVDESMVFICTVRGGDGNPKEYLFRADKI